MDKTNFQSIEDHLFDNLKEDELKKQPWEIKDLQAADWAVKKVVDRQAEINKAEVLAIAYKKRIDEWLDATRKGNESSIEFFVDKLSRWLADELKGQKRRSMDLPHGRVEFRSTPDKIKIVDEKKAIWDCKTLYPEAVKTKEYVDKRILKQAIESKPESELPIGIDIEPGIDKLYVKEK